MVMKEKRGKENEDGDNPHVEVDGGRGMER